MGYDNKNPSRTNKHVQEKDATRNPMTGLKKSFSPSKDAAHAAEATRHPSTCRHKLCMHKPLFKQNIFFIDAKCQITPQSTLL